jgi:hypothetical protein
MTLRTRSPSCSCCSSPNTTSSPPPPPACSAQWSTRATTQQAIGRQIRFAGRRGAWLRLLPSAFTSWRWDPPPSGKRINDMTCQYNDTGISGSRSRIGPTTLHALGQEPVRDPERLEDLERPRVHDRRPVPAPPSVEGVDQQTPNVASLQLRRQHQPGRAGANHQHPCTGSLI